MSEGMEDTAWRRWSSENESGMLDMIMAIILRSTGSVRGQDLRYPCNEWGLYKQFRNRIKSPPAI